MSFVSEFGWVTHLHKYTTSRPRSPKKRINVWNYSKSKVFQMYHWMSSSFYLPWLAVHVESLPELVRFIVKFISRLFQSSDKKCPPCWDCPAAPSDWFYGDLMDHLIEKTWPACYNLPRQGSTNEKGENPVCKTVRLLLGLDKYFPFLALIRGAWGLRGLNILM